MLVKIAISIFLIFLGLFHIIKPRKVSEIIKNAYKYNPLLKNEKQRTSRQTFIIILGIVWVLVGLYVMFFAP